MTLLLKRNGKRQSLMPRVLLSNKLNLSKFTKMFSLDNKDAHIYSPSLSAGRPLNWSDQPPRVQLRMIAALYERIPDLQACEDDWAAVHLFRSIIRNMRNNNRRRGIVPIAASLKPTSASNPPISPIAPTKSKKITPIDFGIKSLIGNKSRKRIITIPDTHSSPASSSTEEDTSSDSCSDPDEEATKLSSPPPLLTTRGLKRKQTAKMQ